MKTIFTSLILGVLLSFSQADGQIYVDLNATGANDGGSWADAYTDLSSAIDDAGLNDEIWVAAGTYLPSGSSNRSKSFVLEHLFHLKLYGGFDGTETSLAERNPSSNLTILSGDVNGDDSVQNDTWYHRSDNLYHILKVTSGGGGQRPDRRLHFPGRIC
jgi:hypothetical protein